MPKISENIIRRIGELTPEFSYSIALYLSPLEFCVASINTVNKNPRIPFITKGKGSKH